MRPVRSWPLLILAAPAFVAVWSGWVGLGQLTGFGTVHPLPGIADDFTIDSAITLPVGVETYAAYALRAWLSTGVSDSARRFARWSALGSLGLGAAGQVAYHLMESRGMTCAPWWITMVVACLPVAVLGMGAALAHLLGASPDTTTVTAAVASVAETEADAETSGVSAAVSTDPVAVVDIPVPMPVEPAPVEVECEAASVSPSTRVSRPVRRVPTGERIARIVAKTPDSTPAQIAARLKLSERTVQRHLSRLAEQSTTTASSVDEAELVAV